MFEFRRLDGSSGIPVYLQSLPEVVQSVSLRWLVFTGSADDLAIGTPGVYHWFEHLTSRGTAKFPGGYLDTEMRLADSGGEAGAHTLPTHTAYYAHVLRTQWKPALEVLTDMIACPLLRPEDVEAERKIIEEELTGWSSSAPDRAAYELPGALWKGHPLGHHPLGTKEDLQSTDPALLRKAFEQGYARPRLLLLVSGSLDPTELLSEVARHVASLSDRPLTERRSPAHYGPLPPWRGGETTLREIPLPGSVIFFVFPVPGLQTETREREYWLLLSELFEAGGLGSPLQRFVREARGLVYSVTVDWAMYPDGGYWGFMAETSRGKAREVLATLEQVLSFSDLRSQKWFDYVMRAVRATPAMRGLDPDAQTEAAENRLSVLGEMRSDQRHIHRLSTISRPELLEHLSGLTRDQAQTIVFEGQS